MRNLAIVAGILLMAMPPVMAAAPEVPVVDGDVPAVELIPGIGPGPHTASFAAVAPATTTGTTGIIHINLQAGISHGFAGVNVAGYTGTLESRLEWQVPGGATGVRTFRCNVLNGVIACMPGFGAFPPAQSLVNQICVSYNYLTLVQGGSGNWGCSITFTGLTIPNPPA
jgi:hypothetical protein